MIEHIIFRDEAGGIDTAIRVMPQTFERMRALPDKVLTDLIDAMLASDLFQTVEPGGVPISDASEKAAVYARMQYLTQELVRRDQDKQTNAIIRMTRAMMIMTLVITFMTIVTTVETIWPHWVQSAVHSLLIRASQVIIDLCGA